MAPQEGAASVPAPWGEVPNQDMTLGTREAQAQRVRLSSEAILTVRTTCGYQERVLWEQPGPVTRTAVPPLLL